MNALAALLVNKPLNILVIAAAFAIAWLALRPTAWGAGHRPGAVRHQKLAVNRRSAEWRTNLRLGDESGINTELYQPLDRRLRFFASARAAGRGVAVLCPGVSV